MSRHRRLVAAPQRGRSTFSLLICLEVPAPSAWHVAPCLSIRTQLGGLVDHVTRLQPGRGRENHLLPELSNFVSPPAKPGVYLKGITLASSATPIRRSETAVYVAGSVAPMP